MPNGGVQEFGGWTKLYRALLSDIIRSKGLKNMKLKPPYKGSKVQVNHVEAVEKEALARIQAANNVKTNNKRQKKNPAAPKNADVDSDHELEFEWV